MRPSQMGRLTPEDFKLDAEILHVVVAQGKDGKTAAIPLLEEGIAAARAIIAIGAFGKWNTEPANRELARAAQEAGSGRRSHRPDPAQLRDRAAPERHRRRRRPGHVRAHERGHDENLRTGADRKAPRRDRATPRHGRKARPAEGRQVAESQYHSAPRTVEAASGQASQQGRDGDAGATCRHSDSEVETERIHGRREGRDDDRRHFERGHQIARIIPETGSGEQTLALLRTAGRILWSGRRLKKSKRGVPVQGPGTVSEILLENRN